jgi:ABC-type uncharacterized transport system involved in gliding motility auxiliary subunit
MNSKLSRLLRLQNIAFYILFLTIIGLLAYLSYQAKFTLDWTYNNRNSLSEPTQILLKNLHKPLTFVFYLPERTDLKQDLTKLVAKYQRIDPTIQLEFVNPDLNPARAKQDGVQNAGQLALHLGDKVELLDSVIDEQVLVNAIQRMSRDHERLVVFLEGHGERDPFATTSNGMSKLITSLARKGFKIQPHNMLRTGSIPDNASFVVLAAPKQDFTPAEVNIIKNYVSKGGNLLWLQDPGGLQGLQPLAQMLGIHIAQGTLIDADLQLQASFGIGHPAGVPVIDYGSTAVTRNLVGQKTLFPFATTVSEAQTKEPDISHWQTQILLKTLPTSWLETSGVLTGSVKYDKGSGDQAGPLSVGVSLTHAIDNKTNTLTQEQRIAVIGDSDFMTNDYIGYGANLTLATNLFNWLGRDDNLVQVPLNRAPDTEVDLSQTALMSIALLFLLVVPLGLAITGLVIWWVRKRR